ncbi:MAG: hypothetical protein WDW38_000767 [Sanguina aurantia]
MMTSPPAQQSPPPSPSASSPPTARPSTIISALTQLSPPQLALPSHLRRRLWPWPVEPDAPAPPPGPSNNSSHSLPQTSATPAHSSSTAPAPLPPVHTSGTSVGMPPPAAATAEGSTASNDSRRGVGERLVGEDVGVSTSAADPLANSRQRASWRSSRLVEAVAVGGQDAPPSSASSSLGPSASSGALPPPPLTSSHVHEPSPLMPPPWRQASERVMSATAVRTRAAATRATDWLWGSGLFKTCQAPRHHAHGGSVNASSLSVSLTEQQQQQQQRVGGGAPGFLNRQIFGGRRRPLDGRGNSAGNSDGVGSSRDASDSECRTQSGALAEYDTDEDDDVEQMEADAVAATAGLTDPSDLVDPGLLGSSGSMALPPAAGGSSARNQGGIPRTRSSDTVSSLGGNADAAGGQPNARLSSLTTEYSAELLAWAEAVGRGATPNPRVPFHIGRSMSATGAERASSSPSRIAGHRDASGSRIQGSPLGPAGADWIEEAAAETEGESADPLLSDPLLAELADDQAARLLLQPPLEAQKRLLYPVGRILHFFPHSIAIHNPYSTTNFGPAEQSSSPAFAAHQNGGCGSSTEQPQPFGTDSPRAGGGGGGASVKVVPVEPSVLFEVHENEAYARIKLCKTMVTDHLIPAYLLSLDSVVKQLHAQAPPVQQQGMSRDDDDSM